MEIVFRPIDAWPHKPSRQSSSRFKAAYRDTMTLLRNELRQLKARNVVIQLDLAERDIRQDGLPRADARPSSVRVVLAFEGKYGALKYFADTFPNWQSNLRAIALGLTCLRTVDRYGITRRGEQYTGWKALPPALLTPPTMTVEEAAKVLQQHLPKGYTSSVAEIIASAEMRKSVYRLSAKATHPDTNGTGNDAAFKLLQQAYELLEGQA